MRLSIFIVEKGDYSKFQIFSRSTFIAQGLDLTILPTF